MNEEIFWCTALPHGHPQLQLGWQGELDRGTGFNSPLFQNVRDGWFYPAASTLTLLVLESFRDCLAHLEVLEGFSKRSPNKQGLERTLWGTRVK